MSRIGRALVAAVVAVLTVVAASALVAPAAWAASEFTQHLTAAQVAGIRDGFANGDDLCDVVGIAAGGVAGKAANGAREAVANAVGVGVGTTGLLCGRNDQPFRNAVDEAYWKGCGVDVTFTDGPMSYDKESRYVVCP